jgi:hypothetical protein
MKVFHKTGLRALDLVFPAEIMSDGLPSRPVEILMKSSLAEFALIAERQIVQYMTHILIAVRSLQSQNAEFI